LAGQGNYHNFVLVDRGGVTARLAMPFADGLTVAAKNAGGEPIAGVAVTISVEPATDQTRDDIIHRMRLRGVFQPAGEGQSELVRQEGSGRWVGLVYQEPGGEPTGIESFTVDEQPAAGWPAATLDPLLGQGGNFRKCLSGRKDGLEWCYLFLAPVEFQKSLVLKSSAPKLGDRLALFYLKK